MQLFGQEAFDRITTVGCLQGKRLCIYTGLLSCITCVQSIHNNLSERRLQFSNACRRLSISQVRKSHGVRIIGSYNQHATKEVALTTIATHIICTQLLTSEQYKKIRKKVYGDSVPPDVPEAWTKTIVDGVAHDIGTAELEKSNKERQQRQTKKKSSETTHTILDWLVREERKHECNRPQAYYDPLPFKIVYTNITMCLDWR